MVALRDLEGLPGVCRLLLAYFFLLLLFDVLSDVEVDDEEVDVFTVLELEVFVFDVELLY